MVCRPFLRFLGIIFRSRFYLSIGITTQTRPPPPPPALKKQQERDFVVSSCLQTKTPSAAEAPQSLRAATSAILDFQAERLFCRISTSCICFARTSTTIHLVQ